jgi:hypothetical protein
MSLAGCVGQPVATAVDLSAPTVTYADISATPAAAATATAAGTLVPTLDPNLCSNPCSTVTPIPLSEMGDLSVQLINRGYRSLSSSSLSGPGGFTYFADLFVDPKLTPFIEKDDGSPSEANEKTFLVAFYRGRGEKKELLSVQGFPAVDHDYAVAANTVNWDNPYAMPTMRMDVIAEADEETKQMLKQTDYSSDINQNGLPEFAFVLEYCPLTCTHDPAADIQLFEIQNSSTIKNISKDLPGLTEYKMHSKNPFTFYVKDSYSYDIFFDISVDCIYTWDGSKFVDVSARYADEYLTEVNPSISDLKSQYGKPFDEEGSKSEIGVLEILKLYEKAGMQEDGLKLFLDITDISHWPNTSELSQCWLQISRGMAQNDFKQNRKFDLPLGSFSMEELHMLKDYEEPLKQAGYDTSACAAINP